MRVITKPRPQPAQPEPRATPRPGTRQVQVAYPSTAKTEGGHATVTLPAAPWERGPETNIGDPS